MLFLYAISSLSINRFSWDVNSEGYFNGNLYYNGVKFMRNIYVMDYSFYVENNPEDYNGVIYTTNITKLTNEDAVYYDINIVNYRAEPYHNNLLMTFYPCYNDDYNSGFVNHIGVNKGWIYKNDQKNFAISFIGKELNLDNNYFEPISLYNHPFYDDEDDIFIDPSSVPNSPFNDTRPWPPSYGKLAMQWDYQLLFPMQSRTLRFKISSVEHIENAPKLSKYSVKSKGNQVGDTINFKISVSECQNGQVVRFYNVNNSMNRELSFLTDKTLFIVDSNEVTLEIPFYCENIGPYKIHIIAVSDLSPYSNVIDFDIDVGTNPKIFNYSLDKNVVFPYNGYITPRVIGHSTGITQFCYKDLNNYEQCIDFQTEDEEKDFNISVDIYLADNWDRQNLPKGKSNFTFYLKDANNLKSDTCYIEITVSDKLRVPDIKHIDGTFNKLGNNNFTLQTYYANIGPEMTVYVKPPNGEYEIISKFTNTEPIHTIVYSSNLDNDQTNEYSLLYKFYVVASDGWKSFETDIYFNIDLEFSVTINYKKFLKIGDQPHMQFTFTGLTKGTTYNMEIKTSEESEGENHPIVYEGDDGYYVFNHLPEIANPILDEPYRYIYRIENPNDQEQTRTIDIEIRFVMEPEIRDIRILTPTVNKQTMLKYSLNLYNGNPQTYVDLYYYIDDYISNIRSHRIFEKGEVLFENGIVYWELPPYLNGLDNIHSLTIYLGYPDSDIHTEKFTLQFELSNILGPTLTFNFGYKPYFYSPIILEDVQIFATQGETVTLKYSYTDEDPIILESVFVESEPYMLPHSLVIPFDEKYSNLHIFIQDSKKQEVIGFPLYYSRNPQLRINLKEGYLIKSLVSVFCHVFEMNPEKQVYFNVTLENNGNSHQTVITEPSFKANNVDFQLKCDLIVNPPDNFVGQTTIKVIAYCDEHPTEEINANFILIESAPVISNFKGITGTQTLGSVVDVEFDIEGRTFPARVVLYYQFNNSHKLYSSDATYIWESPEHIIAQVQLKGLYKPGDYECKYFVSMSDVISSTFTSTFTLSFNIQPYCRYYQENYHQSTYGYNTLFNFSFEAIDYNIGDHVKIFKVINNEETLIKEFDSDGRTVITFCHTFFLPPVDRTFDVYFYAVDSQNARSYNPYVYQLQVKKDLKLWIIGDYPEDFPPNTTQKFELIADDFDPGAKLEVYYEAFNQIVKPGVFVISNENHTTNIIEINVTIPMSNNVNIESLLIFYVQDIENQVDKVKSKYIHIAVNVPPVLLSLTGHKKQYNLGPNSLALLEVTAWDEGLVHLQVEGIYENFYVYNSDKFDTHEGQKVVVPIHVCDYDTDSNNTMKTLTVKVCDKYRRCSDSYAFSYLLLKGLNPPNIVLNRDRSYATYFVYEHYINLTGYVTDEDNESSMNIFYTIDNGEKITIPNTKNGTKFDFRLEIPLENTTRAMHNVVIFAVDSAESIGIYNFKYEVLKYPQLFTKLVDNFNHKPGQIVIITGNLVDFESYEEFDIYTQINREEKLIKQRKVQMKDNFISESFSFEFEAPEQYGRYDVTIFAENTQNYQRSAKRIYSIYIEEPPEIISWATIKPSYAYNSDIEVEFTVKFYGKICYAEFYLNNEFIDALSVDMIQNQVTHKGFIKLKRYKGDSLDSNNLTLIVTTELKSSSQAITRFISFSDNNSPDMKSELLNYNYKALYNFCDQLHFSFIVNDADVSDQLKVYLRRNGNDELIKTIEKSDGIQHEFNYSIENIHRDGKELIIFYVTDGYDTFSVLHLVNIKRNPHIQITTEFEPRKIYRPGTEITVNGFMGDYEPGSYVQAFYTIDFGNTFKNLASPQLLVDNNYRTSEFSFNLSLPSYDCEVHIRIYTDHFGDEGKVLNFIVNTPPKIIQVNSIQEDWRIFEYALIDINVSESSYVTLCYSYDGSNYIHSLEDKYINHTNLNTKWFINAPSLEIYPPGEHNITIFLQDEFFETSELITKTIRLVDSYAPQLRSINIDKEEYNLFEKTKINARFRDFDIGQKLNLFAIIGYGTPQLCGEIISIGTWQNLTIELPVPNTHGIHEITIFIVDETGAKSNNEKAKIFVNRRKQIFIFNQFKRFYYSGEIVPIKFQFGDFEPGSYVSFNYSFDDLEIQSLGKYEILSNGSSKFIETSFVIPNYINDHYFFYWPVDENNELLLNADYFLMGISFKPELKLMNEIKSTYFNPAFIVFNLTVKASTIANVVYNTSLAPNEIKYAYYNARSFCQEISLLCQAEINVEKDTELYISIYIRDRYEDVSKVHTKKIRISTSKSSMNLYYNGLTTIDTILRFSENIDFEVHLSGITSSHPITIFYNVDESPWIPYKSINYTQNEITIPIQVQVPPIAGEHNMHFIAVADDGIHSNFVAINFACEQIVSIILTNLPKSAPPNTFARFSGYVSDYLPNSIIDVEIQYGNHFTQTQSLRTFNNYSSELFNFNINVGSELKAIRYVIKLKKLQNSNYEIIGDLLVNNPPILENHAIINPVYWEGDMVNLDYYLLDDTAAYVLAQIDNYQPKYVQEKRRYYGQNRFYHGQVSVSQSWLLAGSHKLKYWAEDELNMKSKVYTFDLNFDPLGNKAPEISYCSFPSNQIYGFWQPYKMICNVRDRNLDDKIRLRYKLDFGEWNYIEQNWTATGEYEEYEIKFDLPKTEGDFYITMQFIDNKGAGSKYVEDYIRINRKPDIEVINKESIAYKPGDTAVITVYAVDFDPGNTIQFYYKTEYVTKSKILYEDSEIDTVEIYSNYSSNPLTFTFEIPIDAKPSKTYLIAKSSSGLIVQQDIFHTINMIPEVYLISTFEQKYPTTGGFVDLDLRIKDNGKARIFYYIDNPPFLQLTEYIDSNMQDIEIYNLQIPIPRGLEVGKHVLFIFAQDDYEVSSSVLQYDLMLEDAHPPIINIYETKEFVNVTYLDVITINGSVFDEDIGDLIVVNHRIEGNDPVEIFRIVSDGNWHNFTYSFTVPKNSQTVTNAFQAVKNTYRSEIKLARFRVEMPESQMFLPPYLYTDLIYQECKAGVHCLAEPEIIERKYLHDVFNIEPSVPSITFEVQGTHNEIILDTRVLNTMTFNDLLKLVNQSLVTTNFIIRLKDENNQTVQTLDKQIIINGPPILRVNNILQNKLYGSKFIDLDYTINDDTSAKIAIKLDDGDELTITDLIKCNNQEQTGKTQIPIPNDVTFQNHVLGIYAIDEYGAYSNITKHSFFYYDLYHPPTIKVEDIEDKIYNVHDIILFQGSINDLDLDDTIFVKARINNQEYEIKHTCLPENRPNCLKWSFEYQIQNHENFTIRIRAEDSRNSQSEDVEKVIRLCEESKEEIKPEKNSPVPLRTPVPIPYPTRLPIDYSGQRTIIMVPTYTIVSTVGNNGTSTLTYIIIQSEYEVAVISNETTAEIPFFDTVFGKYIIWPLIALIVLIIIGIVVLIVLLKRQKEKESEDSQEPVDMDNETVQKIETGVVSITNDNPLYTTKNGEDDPFKNDFEEENSIPQNDQEDDDELEDIEDTP